MHLEIGGRFLVEDFLYIEVSSNFKKRHMAEINIIKIDGKPLEKLIDVISKGIGTVYKPKAIRKEADAKAYEIEIIERAKSKALAEGKEIDADTYERIQERILHKETKRQNNIDNVSQIAAEQLSQEQTVSTEPVSEDWTTRFFNIVEDVSDSEMQNLWGRILAGEVKQPQSYSLRTLELLKNLNKRDAEVFIKFANLAYSSNGVSFILNFKNEKLLEEKYSIHFGDRLLLEELGLLTANDLQYKLLATKESGVQTVFTIGNVCIVADKKGNLPEQSIQVLVFTKIGQELLQLIKQTPEIDYLQLLATKIRREGVTVKYANIIKIEDGQIHHSGLNDIPLLHD
jgi:uncharacterized repeat protein (TIGR03899 family)